MGKLNKLLCALPIKWLYTMLKNFAHVLIGGQINKNIVEIMY